MALELSAVLILLYSLLLISLLFIWESSGHCLVSGMRVSAVQPIPFPHVLFFPWKVYVLQKWWVPLSLSTTSVPMGTINVWRQAQYLTSVTCGIVSWKALLWRMASGTSGVRTDKQSFKVHLRTAVSLDHPTPARQHSASHSQQCKCPLQDSVMCSGEKCHWVSFRNCLSSPLLRESLVIRTVPQWCPGSTLSGVWTGWVGRGWGLLRVGAVRLALRAVLLWGSSVPNSAQLGKRIILLPKKV